MYSSIEEDGDSKRQMMIDRETSHLRKCDATLGFPKFWSQFTSMLGLASRSNWKSGQSIHSLHSYSGARGSPNNARYIERELLLNSKIASIEFGLENLAPSAAHTIGDFTKCVRAFYHCFFAPVLLYHASVYVHVDGEDFGILIEFGRYENDREHNKPNEVNYWENDGLRFTKIDHHEFRDLVNKHIKCEVENHYSVRDLIWKTHEDGGKWRGSDYSVETHSCQDFAARVIKELKAVRRNPSKVNNHTFDKATFPHRSSKSSRGMSRASFARLRRPLSTDTSSVLELAATTPTKISQTNLELINCFIPDLIYCHEFEQVCLTIKKYSDFMNSYI